VSDCFLSLLKACDNQKICLVTLSGGNHGDTLIELGLMKILGEMGLQFDYVQQDWRAYQRRGFWRKKVDLSMYDLVIIRGGGYINDVWLPGLRFLHNVLTHSKDVVVAPQSYWFRNIVLGKKLRKIHINVTLFARERYSYEFLKGSLLAKNIKVDLAPDSAFYLTKDDIKKYITVSDVVTLLCFRGDIESKITRKRKQAIMQEYSDAYVRDISLTSSLTEYISPIASANVIHTDRLHVAITGAILNKKVFFYSGTYWKNKGVYEYSLSVYPNIRFVEDKQ